MHFPILIYLQEMHLPVAVTLQQSGILNDLVLLMEAAEELMCNLPSEKSVATPK